MNFIIIINILGVGPGRADKPDPSLVVKSPSEVVLPPIRSPRDEGPLAAPSYPSLSASMASRLTGSPGPALPHDTDWPEDVVEVEASTSTYYRYICMTIYYYLVSFVLYMIYR